MTPQQPAASTLADNFIAPARARHAVFVVRIYAGQIALLCTVLLVATLWWTYTETLRHVEITLNNRSLVAASHQQTVGAMLSENGYRVQDGDLVLPPMDTPLEQAPLVQVWQAQPVEIQADGQVLRTATLSGSVADTLETLGIRLAADDRLSFDGGPLPKETLFADLQPVPPNQQSEWGPLPGGAIRPIRLSVLRATDVYVSDDGVASTVHTFAPTVGEMLSANDIRVHANDRISPGVQEPVRAGMRILIERSKPVTIVADGRTFQAHTRERSINRMLATEGIRLLGNDYTNPPLSTPLSDNMQIRVVRVREEMLQEASPIPFNKVLQPDDSLEIDQQQLVQRGQNGEHRKLIRVIYEDGQETRRTVEQEWDARQPTTQITAYGRKLVAHALMTPGGLVQYWRVVHMYATSYSPAQAGVSRDKPWYGHTASGLPAGKGVVAVDKTVVPWLSQLFVPGYGPATAGDTGNGVHGKLIDLGYSDDNYESWHDWVDVYWLWPPPDPKVIRWLLPNYPVERQRF
jgi:uncharacterized protein YabE (DUF348 family)